ncbi:MAG: RNA 2'-phosphotransferase [Bacteroidaceae bacterium]|nr:RNA 2'-phosphotransferase [Bacteroidaceae bacterium]
MGTSKKLSYLLRHSDVPNEQGWIPVEKLVKEFGYTEKNLRQIVSSDVKHRYEFSADFKYVRALYGHSNHVRIKWNAAIPPATLFHGTAKRSIDSILKDGLKGMNRNYVHLSETKEDAIQVGRRHGEPVVLAIDTQKVIDNGGCFYRLPHGIWLTHDVIYDVYPC